MLHREVKVMKKRLFFVLIGLILLCLLCLGVGAIENRKDKAGFAVDLYDVLLDSSYFPAALSVIIGPAKGYQDWRTLDAVGVSFKPEDYQEQTYWGYTQDVFRFDTIRLAKRDYLEQVEWYQSVYSPPGEWTFISDGADERYVSCRKPENVESTHCVWIARYGQIVVEFRGWIAPGYNTLEEMEVLVQAVDEKAVEYIPRDRDY